MALAQAEGELDVFGEYVRRRLEHWGEQYCLHRNMEYLGFHSKNMLQVLIEHRGDMPGRVQGYKPLEVDQEAQFVEEIVASMAKAQASVACVLRAYYCGRGRRKVERWETANMLLTTCGQRAISQRHYLVLHDLGFAEVRGVLRGLALAS
ncbi:MAG TPA: hypothetical protein VIG97_03400 [Luteimonas sp.]